MSLDRRLELLLTTREAQTVREPGKPGEGAASLANVVSLAARPRAPAAE
jgi:hypothetical protein